MDISYEGYKRYNAMYWYYTRIKAELYLSDVSYRDDSHLISSIHIYNMSCIDAFRRYYYDTLVVSQHNTGTCTFLICRDSAAIPQAASLPYPFWRRSESRSDATQHKPSQHNW